VADRDAIYSESRRDVADRDAIYSESRPDVADRDAIYSESRRDVADRDAIYSESRRDVADRDAMHKGPCASAHWPRQKPLDGKAYRLRCDGELGVRAQRCERPMQPAHARALREHDQDQLELHAAGSERTQRGEVRTRLRRTGALALGSTNARARTRTSVRTRGHERCR
jgi:hypothetical protein